MESNKEEARRALDIADRKLSENDYDGAKKIAIKAQALYPRVDGLEQVLKMIDVYLYASNKINGSRGEPDWYGVLGLDPLADDEAVKKRYKKLALLLHPDKNKFNGAEGAFKLVLEAWYLLSDKAKRASYDRKRRRSNQINHKPDKRHKPNSSYTYESEFKPRPEPKPEHKKPEPERKKPEPEPELKKPDPKPEPKTEPKPEPKSETETKPKPDSSLETTNCGNFWTACRNNRCKTYWEFKRDYLNKVLTCQNCSQWFVATEVIPVAHNGRPVIIMSPCNQPMRKSTFSTSASNIANAAPIRMKRWFDPNPKLDSSSNKKETSIFWTVCNRCKTLCKLMRSNSPNKTLACPYCSENFQATEIIPYIVNGRPVITSSLLPFSKSSSSKNTTSSSTSSASASATAKPKTAYQSGDALKRFFPESREKIAADFAFSAAGGNANVAYSIYKKMTTGNKNSALETETDGNRKCQAV
ncbi:PREDICTED: uncharacterized protein LOC104718359 isoform X1 [Camelina sativa]|uniref:Uncharacterized protein LOC104718359 isoform X1 n=1 Tax=Camelina sativa TaxID=90675 RepID=A0ABM0U1B8_CAMSA|nr:PREDICTED: uncharacterized protein LOC104718359 isoform X1 [Camelina sativa]